MHDAAWLLLIYVIPATPSRKRAFIWRELKKIGAVYLRDGVAVLPRLSETTRAMQAVAAKVDELGGEATLVDNAHLEPVRVESIVAQARAARAREYADIRDELERLADYVQRERAHREFTNGEVDELDADLARLQRWAQQVVSRDHFADGLDQPTTRAFARCAETIAALSTSMAFRERVG